MKKLVLLVLLLIPFYLFPFKITVHVEWLQPGGKDFTLEVNPNDKVKSITDKIMDITEQRSTPLMVMSRDYATSFDDNKTLAASNIKEGASLAIGQKQPH